MAPWPPRQKRASDGQSPFSEARPFSRPAVPPAVAFRCAICPAFTRRDGEMSASAGRPETEEQCSGTGFTPQTATCSSPGRPVRHPRSSRKAWMKIWAE